MYFFNKWICDITDCIKKYHPKVGNSALHCQVMIHNHRIFDEDKKIKVPVDRKTLPKNRRKGSTYVSLPFSFWEHKKEFQQLAQSLEELRQSYSESSSINVNNSLPCRKNLSGSTSISAAMRDNFHV